MRRRIDAASEPRGDDIATLAEIPCDLHGEFPPGDRGIARADDRHHWPAEAGDLAAHADERRSGIDMAEPGRIIGLADRDHANAGIGRGSELTLCFSLGGDADLSAATRGELRQSRERVARIA